MRIAVESDGVIDSLLKSIAQKDWRNSLQLDEVNVKAKNVNITGLKNVYRSGPSTWTKNYEGSGNNWDYMNLTLSADNMLVDIEELSIGEFKSHFWFDIQENEVKMMISSQGYVSPGECLISIDDINIVSLGGVIMHSEISDFEGHNVTAAANAVIPFLNKLAKTKPFESYLQSIAGKFCVIKIADINKVM
uniref:Uncharacterized protein n=1 Tax=Rhodnius prolixus TaxID=13249 RepID=T1HXX2_RHOPR